MKSINKVALRKESVDRNDEIQAGDIVIQVALRKESVDRNRLFPTWGFPSLHVALRKESVDRNRVLPRSLMRLNRRSPQGERG